MTYARIIGTGSYLPEKVLTNRDLENMVETSDEWIFARTGIRERHIAAPDETASELALKAAQRALQAANLQPSELDLIIVATTTPDMIFPSTACILQGKLGVAGCAAFDVQAVCTGFVYALATADLYIRSGQAKTALVVGAEVYSRILDWKDRTTCVLFGDGAGAMVLARSETPGILGSRLHADGSHSGILCVPGTVVGGQVQGQPFVKMEGNAVFKFAVRVLGDVVEEVLPIAGWNKSDIDWLVPHQANIRIIEATAKRLDLPMEHVIVSVERHGNTSAASIPLAVDEACRAGRVRPGHHVMLVGVGGGFTWGAVAVNW